MHRMTIIAAALAVFLTSCAFAADRFEDASGFAFGGGTCGILGEGTGGNKFEDGQGYFLEYATRGGALGITTGTAVNKVGNSSVDAKFFGVYGELRIHKGNKAIQPYYGFGGEWGTMTFDGANGKAGLFKCYLCAGAEVPLSKGGPTYLSVRGRYSLIISDSDLGHSSGLDLQVGVGWFK